MIPLVILRRLHKFRVIQLDGIRGNIKIAITKTPSVEFFLRVCAECIEFLENVESAANVPWNGLRNFHQLERVLDGRPLQSYCKIKHDYFDYADDQTLGNYELFLNLITKDLHG